MLGDLPMSLRVGGQDYPIRADFRAALLILQAFSDSTLSDYARLLTTVSCLYRETPPAQLYEEAYRRAVWFLDGGDSMPAQSKRRIRLYDWEQDAGLIFPAVSRAAGCEIRALPFFHWWSFLSCFMSVGEGTFSTVVAIRDKLSRGKKLESWERELLRDNPDMVKLKQRLSPEEEAELERLRNIFK